MKFIKGKFFFKYYGHWINLPLEIQTHGGGVKGLIKFVKGVILCAFGFHSYGGRFKFERDEQGFLTPKSFTRCMYCHREVTNEADN